MATYDTWGGSWGTPSAWGTSWFRTTTVDPDAFQCGVFDPVAFDTNCPEGVAGEGRGNWNLNKRNPPKRGKTIRFSDFETQEAFAAAMREVIRIPMSEISDAPIVEAYDDDEDDELLLLAVMRMLH